jgi:4-hydroxybenzoate polyprenyltransferase
MNPWVARGLALLSAVYLLYLVVISIGQAGDAEEAGYVVGTVVGVLAIALVVRLVYVRLRPSDSRPAFWSPWIVVIAAIVMVLTRVIDAS